jgi:nucleotide-binding universal stress UspA family protein
MTGKTGVQGLARVLLYYDASYESRAALIHACSLCRAFEAELHIQVVVDIESAVACAGAPFTVLAKTDLDECANAILDDALRRSYAKGTNAKGIVSFGEVICCMKETASAIDACAMVVGHRKRAWLSRLWFSVDIAERLLNEADQRIVIAVKPT